MLKKQRWAVWVRWWLGWMLVLTMLAGMIYSLVFSDYGYLVYRKEHQRFSILQAKIVKLRQQREKLAGKILHLRHDPEALEELVHRELGYVHPDEYMLILPEGSGVKDQKSGVGNHGSRVRP